MKPFEIVHFDGTATYYETMKDAEEYNRLYDIIMAVYDRQWKQRCERLCKQHERGLF